MTSQSRPSGAPHAGHPGGTKLLSFLHHFLGHYRPPWQTVYDHFSQWSKRGVWEAA